MSILGTSFGDRFDGHDRTVTRRVGGSSEIAQVIHSLFDGRDLDGDVAFGGGGQVRDRGLQGVVPEFEEMSPASEFGPGATTDFGFGKVRRSASNSGYAGTGSWAVQLGEAAIDTGDIRLFINVVDPFGGVVLQLHGMPTDRTFGDVLPRGTDIECQLRVYAFLGDFFGDVERVLHPPMPVGSHQQLQVLVSELAVVADVISDANIDYCPADIIAAGDDAQNGNSVISTLAAVIARHVPDFDPAATVGWQVLPGVSRNLMQDIARPFAGIAGAQGLPAAPPGRIAPFSATAIKRWQKSAEKQHYATTVMPSCVPQLA